MESKKINQLATELSPALSDLTIIGDPNTGISKKITLSQMASLFTGTVEEYASLSAFPLVGAADTIYIALDTNIIYRWNTGTNAYVELSPNIVTSLVFNDANGFDGTISLVGSTATLTITTALTTGSIGFIGTSGALLEDNANFFWNNSTKRLGINTNAPTTALDVFGSGIIGRVNGTSTNNAFIGFASAGTNKWSIGNVQSDHRFRIYSEANTSELVSVLQTGQFGIGIANPTTKLHIDGGSTALIANLDADVSVAKSISFRSDNSNRINLEVSGTESGSNAGANFFLRAYSDAGALLNTPLTITRSTGAATFISSITATSAILNGTGVSPILLTLTSGNPNCDITLQSSASTNIVRLRNGSDDFQVFTNNVQRLTISSAGISTFTSGSTSPSLIAIGSNNGNGLIQISGSANYQIGAGTDYGGMNFKVGGTDKLIIANSGAATFSSSITAGGFGSFTAASNGSPVLTLGTAGAINAVINTADEMFFNIDSNNDQTAACFVFGTNRTGTTGGTELVRIKDNGNVGIGEDNPTFLLDMKRAGGFGVRLNNTADSSDTYIQYNNTGSSFSIGINNDGWFSYTGGTKTYDWWNANVVRMRLSTSHNLMIGSTTDNGNKLQVNGSASFSGDINLSGSAEINHTGRIILDAGAGNGFLFRTNNVGTTAFDIQSNGSTTMNGGYFQMNAILSTYANGTHSIQDSNPNDTGSRVVLDIIGGTYNTGSDSSSKMIRFRGGNGTEIGYIIRNGGATISYISSSDYRLKEDLQEFNGLDLISKIKTYDFKWIGSEHRDYGVIAHELKEIVPNIVSGEKDDIDEETGNMKPQGLDYGKLTPILVKAIQELKAEIQLLKTK